MVHARVLEAYIQFPLMYMEDHIFPVLLIKDLINNDCELTTPFKLETGTKPSVSHLSVLFFMCCMKIYCICWGKGVKYAPLSAKGVFQYLRWNSTASKRVSCVRIHHK